jgi:hypothetical protein
VERELTLLRAERADFLFVGAQVETKRSLVVVVGICGSWFMGFIFLSATGGEADFICWRCGCERLTADPTGENEPTPDERLPPRETRTELRRTTACTPELHGQRNALEIERCNPTLKLLPTNADQHLPTPSGPTDLKMLSHTFY